MDIEKWPITRPVPYARNARVITDAAVAKVAASLKEYGWRQPIVVDSDGVVVCGHTRLQAAQRLGMTEVPVHVAHELTPAQIKAYRLADNRTGQEATWDMDLLAIELGEFDLDISAIADLTGFDAGEIERIGGLDDGADEVDDSEKYTSKSDAPIYEPTGECPEIDQLVDTTVADKLTNEIDGSDIPPPVADFLRAAAMRHAKFDYKAIAEYYAHAPAEVQRLMENSALVIIDIERAIELGYAMLQAEVRGLISEENA